MQTSYYQGDEIEINVDISDSETEIEDLEIRAYWEIDGSVSEINSLTLPGSETTDANEIRVWLEVVDGEHRVTSDTETVSLSPAP